MILYFSIFYYCCAPRNFPCQWISLETSLFQFAQNPEKYWKILPSIIKSRLRLFFFRTFRFRNENPKITKKKLFSYNKWEGNKAHVNYNSPIILSLILYGCCSFKEMSQLGILKQWYLKFQNLRISEGRHKFTFINWLKLQTSTRHLKKFSI